MLDLIQSFCFPYMCYYPLKTHFTEFENFLWFQILHGMFISLYVNGPTKYHRLDYPSNIDDSKAKHNLL